LKIEKLTREIERLTLENEKLNLKTNPTPTVLIENCKKLLNEKITSLNSCYSESARLIAITNKYPDFSDETTPQIEKRKNRLLRAIASIENKNKTNPFRGVFVTQKVYNSLSEEDKKGKIALPKQLFNQKINYDRITRVHPAELVLLYAKNCLKLKSSNYSSKKKTILLERNKVISKRIFGTAFVDKGTFEETIDSIISKMIDNEKTNLIYGVQNLTGLKNLLDWYVTADNIFNSKIESTLDEIAFRKLDFAKFFGLVPEGTLELTEEQTSSFALLFKEKAIEFKKIYRTYNSNIKSNISAAEKITFKIQNTTETSKKSIEELKTNGSFESKLGYISKLVGDFVSALNEFKKITPEIREKYNKYTQQLVVLEQYMNDKNIAEQRIKKLSFEKYGTQSVPSLMTKYLLAMKNEFIRLNALMLDSNHYYNFNVSPTIVELRKIPEIIQIKESDLGNE
jgi:hypothetical protein